MKAIHWAFASLMGLLTLTAAASSLPLGFLGSQAVGYGIAGLKCVIVGAVFMRLREENPSIRFVALAGLIWVGLLVSIVAADYLTRGSIGVLGK